MAAQSVELLIEFTRDPDPRARAMAVAGLAKSQDPRAFAPVVVALFDPMDEVRAVAATALGIIGDERAFEPLLEGLKDPCEQVAVNSAWGIGHMPGPRAVPKLLEYATNPEVAEPLRCAALTALGERADEPTLDLATNEQLREEVRQALFALVQTADEPEVCATGVWALGHFPSPENVPLLEDALRSTHEWTVRYAIEAVVHARETSMMDLLAELMFSEHEEVTLLALKAIDILKEHER